MSHSAASVPAVTEASIAVAATTLHVTRGKVPVLRGLDFAIQAGEITGLLGPSGSGKTTLMRAIMGVQVLTSGSVQVLGLPAGHPDLRHRVGYVTQSPSVYPDLTVEANVRYFGAMHRKGRAEAAEAIAAVGLEPQARQKTGDLSGGQLSRVSLACALVARPSLLVLDEPTVGLDPVLRADLWDRFRSMAESGTTLLVSSHVMEEASHCGSLLLLREGKLLAQLTPAELSQRGHSADLEKAFLHIIQDTAEVPSGSPERTVQS
ncbi:ABC transporter ATP-binding protein [Pseudarthrobacter cellobiosi]|uniref:ABC transporter ATP-binding protein n=1 Tax=Pseudarthrobacter cellobiosi TaxID=2953654 RepID=UPI00208F09EE|nr:MULTISPECIES: ABC transporter ATP-binding protein [unclassified Pseudarthrobacter]MCO4255528.1 ABC transporter ATP-binding protein [Pseudarthrobacter sp. HLT1-5]MCO4273656.1 ABC transporter ATP-binding protein [Pseudarthrobacter sp. HLT3-5]